MSLTMQSIPKLSSMKRKKYELSNVINGTYPNSENYMESKIRLIGKHFNTH